jgi:predicted glycogen debranching enzyme
MADPVLLVPWPSTATPPMDELAMEEDPTSPFVTREWLVTNGLGGYASGTVATIATRRYHGLLVAALPPPLGRTMFAAQASETVRLASGKAAQLGAQPGPPSFGVPLPQATLVSFRLELGLPVWRYEFEDVVIERRLWMAHRQNTVYASYRLLAASAPVAIEIEPWIHFRPHDGPLDTPNAGPYALTVVDDRYEVSAPGYPPLRMHVDRDATTFTIDRRRMRDVGYLIEKSRGYDAVGELYGPGYFHFTLLPEATVTFVASVESWDTLDRLTPTAAYEAEATRRRQLLAAAHPDAREGLAAHLVLAADQFVIAPPDNRDGSPARDDSRTVIAGYHWFTDWGRDTMISLEGLTLTTGRAAEASGILRTFAEYIRDGLIPNLFPEHGSAGLYHTADATLWFFHAVDRYLEATGDRALLDVLLPKLVDVADHHVKGTRFNIGVAADGLLAQGAPGYALTWMDAKVGDLVVTPRRGKAVEINALWYNALSLLAGWLHEVRGAEAAAPYAALAKRAYDAFNQRFWYAEGGYLYDLVDGEHGDDPAFRPNQVLAVSLRHAVLDPSRWATVVEQVRAKLATPVGLRSLAKDQPDYRAKYFGDLHARDLAYHQGTVWAWLVGPLVDATLKVNGRPREARELMAGFVTHLTEAGVGSISEIFDAEGPFTPRGCIAQAWSVAEVLRCLVKTAR